MVYCSSCVVLCLAVAVLATSAMDITPRDIAAGPSSPIDRRPRKAELPYDKHAGRLQPTAVEFVEPLDENKNFWNPSTFPWGVRMTKQKPKPQPGSVPGAIKYTFPEGALDAVLAAGWSPPAEDLTSIRVYDAKLNQAIKVVLKDVKTTVESDGVYVTFKAALTTGDVNLYDARFAMKAGRSSVDGGIAQRIYSNRFTFRGFVGKGIIIDPEERYWAAFAKLDKELCVGTERRGEAKSITRPFQTKLSVAEVIDHRKIIAGKKYARCSDNKCILSKSGRDIFLDDLDRRGVPHGGLVDATKTLATSTAREYGWIDVDDVTETSPLIAFCEFELKDYDAEQQPASTTFHCPCEVRQVRDDGNVILDLPKKTKNKNKKIKMRKMRKSW